MDIEFLVSRLRRLLGFQQSRRTDCQMYRTTASLAKVTRDMSLLCHIISELKGSLVGTLKGIGRQGLKVASLAFRLEFRAVVVDKSQVKVVEWISPPTPTYNLLFFTTRETAPKLNSNHEQYQLYQQCHQKVLKLRYYDTEKGQRSRLQCQQFLCSLY